jgi:hypothetical protein
LIWVSDQEVNCVAEIPLNFTPDVPCNAPKFVPVIVTSVHTGPEVGESKEMPGGGITVKVTPLEVPPAVVTVTGPLAAPVGALHLIWVSDQEVNCVGVTPLNLTDEDPWDAPKFVPVIVTSAPTGPEVGASEVMLGGGMTVKVTPLEVPPAVVTVTGPVAAPVGALHLTWVSDHEVKSVAETPLNFTNDEPWDVPKFAPVIVTSAPTNPEVGASEVMLGEGMTVKVTPLEIPPAVVTVTGPVATPVGALHLI